LEIIKEIQMQFHTMMKRLDRWINGETPITPVAVAVAKTVGMTLPIELTHEEKISKALVALDLLVGFATIEVRENRKSPEQAAQALFNSMPREMKRYLPGMTYEQLLEGIQAELDMPLGE
jgi:hypothetical protein